jgi:hypothetical protein
MRMRRTNRLIVALLAGAALAVSGCGGSSSDEGGGEPATVEPVKGTDLNQVKLTAQAADRLGIRTAKVRGRGAQLKVVPYGAVVYNADGTTFTYTSPKPLVYVRAPIRVQQIVGGEAILASGPAVGTEVVTIGSQELYGSEYEVEED